MVIIVMILVVAIVLMFRKMIRHTIVYFPDINECTETTSTNQDTPSHDCEHICINQLGSYTCQCRDGFVLDADGRHCNDVDDCITGDHDCTGLLQCENSIGNFRCVCPYGYTQVGRSCNNVDECSAKNDKCSQGCTDEPGSYTCWCIDGFELQAPGYKTCKDIDECQTQTHNCSGLFECNNILGGYECVEKGRGEYCIAAKFMYFW